MANNQKALKKLCDEIIKEFRTHITDYVFLTIEDNKVLLKKYLDQIAATGSLKGVNGFLGKQIKEQLKLKNIGGRGKKPKSKLIQTYQKH